MKLTELRLDTYGAVPRTGIVATAVPAAAVVARRLRLLTADGRVPPTRLYALGPYRRPWRPSSPLSFFRT
jgi:hypothetical protein